MEKELKYKVGKVHSEAKEGRYSFCLEVVPDDPRELTRGVLLAVVSISASSKFDAEAAGKKVLAALRENFYSQNSGGILVALEHAVVAAHQRLLTIVFSGGDESAVDFDLVAGVLWGSVFYLAQLGNGRAVILRGGKLRLIGHKKDGGELAASDRPEVKTASGLLEDGDVLSLGTPKFFELVPNVELEAMLGAESVKKVTNEIAGKVKEDPMAAGVVLMIGGGVEEAVTNELEPVKESAKVEKEELREPEKIEPPKEDADLLAKAACGGRVQVSQFKGRLDTLVAKAKGGLGPVGMRAGEQVGTIRRRYGRKEYLNIFMEKVRQLWDRLGRPRTAMEGVDQAKNRRTLLTLAALLLVILLVGVVINNFMKGSGRDRGRFDNLVSTAQGQYDEAQQAQSNDKARAEELLASASDNLKEAGGMHFDDKKVGNLQSKIVALLDGLEGIVAVNPTQVFDLSSLRLGAQGSAMTGGGVVLYVLDAAGALYSVNVSGKSGEVLSSDVALKHGSGMTLVGNSLYSMVPGAGIYSYDLISRKLTLVSAVSPTWGRIDGMAGYQNFLYLLDSGNNMIWRYSPTARGLGSATTWLKSGSDLSGASAISVDGSVWVGGKGTVGKYANGRPSAFIMSGNPQLGQVTVMYEDAATKNIYLVNGKSVVVVGKDGQYVGQYKSDKFDGVTGIAVDEGAGKAYILAQSKVYEFDLKQ